jgi:DNA repair exonuclease SbcCD ATPase subunit
LQNKPNQRSLVRSCEHYLNLETIMTEDTTTSEQLAEIEGQPEPVQVREGRWKTRGGKIVQVVPTDEARERDRNNGWLWMGAAASESDYWHADGTWLPARAPHDHDLVAYLGPIEAQPEPQPEPQATQYTPPEGWRLVETHEELDIPGRDQYVRGPNRYIRPIEPQPELPADTAEELRSEVSYVQNLLGESRQRVTQLEELVASLRTINAAQEKAVVDAGKANDKHVDTIGQMQRELQQQHRELQKRALRIFDLDTINAAQEKAVVDAGKENTALRRQLAVVKEELTTAAAVSQQLQIELDAAQQVPADSPELQQLRLRLADMTLDRDQCKNAYDQIFADLVTIRETTAADTVEAIIEWLEPFRGCNSPSLALLLLEALPHIIRNIVGLNTEDVE